MCRLECEASLVALSSGFEHDSPRPANLEMNFYVLKTDTILLIPQNHTRDERANLFVVGIELLVLQHIEKHTECSRFSSSRRTLDEGEVASRTVGWRLGNRLVQRSLHCQQLTSIEAGAKIVDERRTTTCPGELVRYWRVRRGTGAEGRVRI